MASLNWWTINNVWKSITEDRSSVRIQNHSLLNSGRIIQIIWEADPHSFDSKERFLKKTASALAGLAVGHYKIGEFFARVEFES